MLELITLAADNPVDHVVPHAIPGLDNWMWSNIQSNLILSVIILVVGGLLIARSIETGPQREGTDRYVTKNRFAHMIEVICLYLRDSVVRPLLHERTDKMMPFLWTVFFFILVNNMLGLVPFLDLQHFLFPEWKKAGTAVLGGTATQSLAVTGGLALIAGIAFNVAGIRELGFKEYIKHQTGGVPLTLPFLPIVALVFVIELVGNLFIKPVALAIRLFANMTAGHILLATLFLFSKMGASAGPAIGIPVGIASFLGSIAIYFLEIFVGFLQAFVFMFLTTVFISLLSHHEDHDHEHAHDHGHDDLPEAQPAAA
jgi:F-type H+-transporting ATPase subunit a